MHNTSKHNNATTKDKSFIFCPYLFCSKELPEDMRSYLSEHFEIRSLPCFKKLPAPVSSHADMLIFKNSDKLIMHRDYYNENKSLFDGIGYNIILSDEDIRPAYPHDILFNALNLSDTVVANKKHISRFILSEFENVTDVRQGYTSCSCLKVCDDAVITADAGIANVLRAQNKEVLLISPGNITLEGYGYGFIGGASFVYGDTVYFFGDLQKHPDSAKISEFITSHGKSVLSLSDDTLTDIGGALVIELTI